MADAPTTNPPAAESAPVSGDVIREQDKIMLVLAYFGILSLIPLLTVKDSDYVKWHAKQGLALAICTFVLMIFSVIPFIGWLIGCVAFVGALVLMVMGIVKAFKPERWKMPVISMLAEKF